MLSNNKRKTSDDNELTKRIKESESVEEEVIHAVWSHYRSYLESEEKSDEENEPEMSPFARIVKDCKRLQVLFLRASGLSNRDVG